MAHPMKKASMDGINAKMRRMTEGYGSASGPANNKLAPTNMEKGEGPQDAAGFGAESGGMPKSRGDRAGRRPAITNPVPTYAKGGAVARARGGRTKKGKGATHVNVIVAPQGGATPPMPMPPPALAGPPPGAMPPMPPKPPMGAPPMGGGLPPGAAGLPMAPGAPGGMPPGLVPPRKRGGRVHADEAEDKALIKKMVKAEDLKGRAKGGRVSDDEGDAVTERTLKNEGLVRERARGGRMPHMTAGAATGVGRLEKIGEKPKDAGKPQAV